MAFEKIAREAERLATSRGGERDEAVKKKQSAEIAQKNAEKTAENLADELVLARNEAKQNREVLEEENRELQEKVENLEGELAKLEETAGNYYRTAETELRGWRKKKPCEVPEHTDLEDEIKELERELEENKKTNSDLNSRLSEVEGEKERVEDENRFLAGKLKGMVEELSGLGSNQYTSSSQSTISSLPNPFHYLRKNAGKILTAGLAGYSLGRWQGGSNLNNNFNQLGNPNEIKLSSETGLMVHPLNQVVFDQTENPFLAQFNVQLKAQLRTKNFQSSDKIDQKRAKLISAHQVNQELGLKITELNGRVDELTNSNAILGKENEKLINQLDTFNDNFETLKVQKEFEIEVLKNNNRRLKKEKNAEFNSFGEKLRNKGEQIDLLKKELADQKENNLNLQKRPTQTDLENALRENDQA